MSTNTNTENHLSCGGIVFKNEGPETKIVICGRQQEDEWLWGLPKGTPNPHETNQETAIREVTEETGIIVSFQGSDNFEQEIQIQMECQMKRLRNTISL